MDEKVDDNAIATSDLRGFLQRLEANGELQKIQSTVDPYLTVGAIAQRLAERGGPAAHFMKVAGAGHQITWVSGVLGRGRLGLWSKLALAMGIDPTAKYQDILEEFTRRRESAVRPMQVGGGQCKEVILKKGDIDLTTLSAPILHEGDDGACLTSWAFAVAASPDSNNAVWDILPLSIKSKNTMVGRLPVDSSIGRLFRKQYQATGKPMPIAFVFGAAPMVTAAAAFRRGRKSFTAPELAGSLQRSPVQLVKCETNELLVPANAELILEGFVSPDSYVKCQPFGSSFGYRSTAVEEDGLEFKIEAMTHRRQPVLPLCAWGTPINDLHIVQGLDRDAQLKARFENAGAPVCDVFSPPWLAGAVVAVSTQVPYTAYAQTVAGVVRMTEGTKNTPYILVFNDDIDITNPVSLFHALVTKCHPKRDTWIIKNAEAAADAPYLTAEDKRNKYSARAIFDCTWPLDWDPAIAIPPKVSFDECYPKELQEKVLAEWVSKLGFPKETERPV